MSRVGGELEDGFRGDVDQKMMETGSERDGVKFQGFWKLELTGSLVFFDPLPLISIFKLAPQLFMSLQSS